MNKRTPLSGVQIGYIAKAGKFCCTLHVHVKINK